MLFVERREKTPEQNRLARNEETPNPKRASAVRGSCAVGWVAAPAFCFDDPRPPASSVWVCAQCDVAIYWYGYEGKDLELRTSEHATQTVPRLAAMTAARPQLAW